MPGKAKQTLVMVPAICSGAIDGNQGGIARRCEHMED
jgi:hypothetical protein